eukprot:gene14093-20046_t
MHRIRSTPRIPSSGSWGAPVAHATPDSANGIPQPVDREIDSQSKGAKNNKGIKTSFIRVLHKLAATRNLTFGLVVLVASLLSLASWVAWQYFLTPGELHHKRYAVYVDAGSSGTRVHVFEFQLARWPAYVRLKLPELTFAVEPGLSHYADDPDEASASLRTLLDFAYSKVPEPMWHTTPVHLLATAGLRMLREEQVDAILQRCSSLLASSHFQFRRDWARVIGGDLEGLYGWAAVNYVSGALEEAAFHHHHSRKEILDPTMFSGVLEMGGASMQITFLPVPADAITEKVGTRVALPALERAAEVVIERYSKAKGDMFDPCLPIGYRAEDGRNGNASFNDCLVVARNIIPFCGRPPPSSSPPPAPTTSDGSSSSHDTSHDKGSSRLRGGGMSKGGSSKGVQPASQGKAGRQLQDYASIIRDYHGDLNPSLEVGQGGVGSRRQTLSNGEDCDMDGVRLPPLSGSFVAMENFFWTAKALGMHNEATLQELHDAGHRYCSRHWSSLHAEFSGHIPDQYLTRYCFASAYIFSLLHQDANSGSDVGMSWVVGAMLVEAMNTERHGTFHFLSRGGEHVTHGKHIGLLLPVVGVLGALALLMLHVLARTALKQPLKHPVHALLHESNRDSAGVGGVQRVPSSSTLIRIPSDRGGFG